MKQSVRMVRVKFGSVYVSKLVSESLIELYKKHSDLETERYGVPQPSGMEYSEWHKIAYSEDAMKLWLADNPCYKSFELNIQLDKFSQMEFDHFDEVRMQILERFTVDVECDFHLDQLNEHLSEKQDVIYANMKKQLEMMNEIGKAALNSSQHYNSKCGTPVSDAFLYQVDRILLLEDACSDTLQRNLNDGWRIIYVAPQPDQRRPDYILGKVVGTASNSNYAERE